MKQVGKLIFKCFCVMLPFIVLGVYMWKNSLAFFDDETPYYIWNKEKTNTKQDKNYRVLILGDSVSNAAYAPEILSSETLNLALGGATPMESYYILQDWLNNNSIPEVIYISFQDSHFKMEDCFWKRTMYSHRFSLSQNLEMLESAINYNEKSILTEQYWLDFISYELYLPHKYITAFMNASFNQRHKNNLEITKLDEIHNGRYISRNVGENKKGYSNIYKEFTAKPLFDEYYRKIIELCIEKGITPRIVKLPLPDDTEFTENYKKMFYEYYNNLKKDYPSITVDWFPLYQKNNFADAAHMNAHGSFEFSTQLKELYSEDFDSSKIDREQLLAIDDSLKTENKIEYILKWISEKDYTVLFYDKKGTFKSMYEEHFKKDWKTESLNLEFVSLESHKYPNVLMINGTGKNTMPISVSTNEKGLIIQFEGNKQEWVTSNDNTLGVMIINNYNKSIVSTKSFQYTDATFVLQ